MSGPDPYEFVTNSQRHSSASVSFIKPVPRIREIFITYSHLFGPPVPIVETTLKWHITSAAQLSRAGRSPRAPFSADRLRGLPLFTSRSRSQHDFGHQSSALPLPFHPSSLSFHGSEAPHQPPGATPSSPGAATRIRTASTAG